MYSNVTIVSSLLLAVHGRNYPQWLLRLLRTFSRTGLLLLDGTDDWLAVCSMVFLDKLPMMAAVTDTAVYDAIRHDKTVYVD